MELLYVEQITCCEWFLKCNALYAVHLLTLHTTRYDVIGTLPTDVICVRTHTSSFATLHVITSKSVKLKLVDIHRIIN